MQTTVEEAKRFFRRARWVTGVVAALATASLLFAACGGDSTSSSTGGTGESTDSGETSGSSESGEAATAAALTEDVSPQKFQQTLDEAFGPGTVKPADLPRIEADAFKIAAQPVSPELEAKLLECMKQTSCETGHGELTLAIAETFGGNAYRQQLRAISTLQLLRYPQVKKIIYTDGEFDLQKTLSNFRSLIAQGVDGIMGNMDFGSAMLPAAREAAAQGIPVVTGPAAIAGSAESELGVETVVNNCKFGEETAERVSEGSSNGTAALYTGTVGNPVGAVWMPCAEKVLDAAGWTVSITGNTEWTPQGSQQAAAAMLAKGVPDAMIYDYTPNAFNEKIFSSGSTPPTEALNAIDFNAFKQWLDAPKDGHPFDMFLSASQLQTDYVAASVLVEKGIGQGSDIPWELEIPNPVIPAKEYETLYDPSLPEEFSFNSLLPASVLEKIAG